MFQPFDKSTKYSRQEWIALLARAPQHLLDKALGEKVNNTHQWLRRPETGLMMVQGRVGGTGERFNLGEVTITRCALRLSGSGTDAPVGVSYVLGRNYHQAQLAAVADALLQDPDQFETLQATLLNPLSEHLQQEQAERHARAQSTKVDFLTVAREASGDTKGSES